MHDRVADERHLEDVVAVDPRVRGELGRQLREAAANGARQLLLRAPGFIITYDTRLIRSSPKRICGFIAPAEASTSPVREVAEVAGDGGRADVERDAVARRRGTRARRRDRRRRRAPRRSPPRARLRLSSRAGVRLDRAAGPARWRGRSASQERSVSPHSRSSASRSRVRSLVGEARSGSSTST